MPDNRADLAVVGGGPAGLSAAVVAAEAGASVLLVDAGSQPGGQYWRHPDESSAGTHRTDRDRAERDAEAAGQHGWARYRRLRDRMRAAVAVGRLHHVAGRQVWRIDPDRDDGFSLATTAVVGRDNVPASDRVLRARRLILATGAYDRQLPIPGWTLPGVMAAGGVQALLKAHGVAAGRRAIVAGTGPFLLPVATALAAAGAEVVAVCEANALGGWARDLVGALQQPSKLLEGAEYARHLVGHRIPVRTRTVVAGIHGSDRVEAATLARVDATGRIRPGTERRVGADLVALGWGFTPQLETAIDLGLDTRVDGDGSLVIAVDGRQRTSLDGVFAAGETTGIGGAALACVEGELAGLSATAELGHPSGRTAALIRAVRRGRRFAAALHRATPVPEAWPEWTRPDTVLCRCEEVTCGEVMTGADALGAIEPRDARVTVRPGMGWCQGRVCGSALAAMLARRVGRPWDASELAALGRRPLGSPLRLDEVAELDTPPGP